MAGGGARGGGSGAPSLARKARISPVRSSIRMAGERLQQAQGAAVIRVLRSRSASSKSQGQPNVVFHVVCSPRGPPCVVFYEARAFPASPTRPERFQQAPEAAVPRVLRARNDSRARKPRQGRAWSGVYGGSRLGKAWARPEGLGFFLLRKNTHGGAYARRANPPQRKCFVGATSVHGQAR